MSRPQKRFTVKLRSDSKTFRFIRMAFKEYGTDHEEWRNPFDKIDPPAPVQDRPRDTLQEHEIIKLFMPGVITDPLEQGVALAMFWAGLRRAEIFGLKHEDLDWRTPKLNIVHAWKRFGETKFRTLGDPKWHKTRVAPFPEELQEAIKKLKKAHGIHEFVFCHKDGTLPSGRWIERKLPVWMKRAGIDPEGRHLVPHSSRNSLAAQLEDQGVSLRYIGDLLGHSSIKTTKIYLPEAARAIRNLGRKISEARAAVEQEKAAQQNVVDFKVS